MRLAQGQMVLIGEPQAVGRIWVEEMNPTVGSIGFISYDVEDADEHCTVEVRYPGSRGRRDRWSYPVCTLTPVSEEGVTKEVWLAVENP